MNERELKLCPFCGGKSQVRENYLGQTFVYCERCGSKTWFTQDDYCVRKDIVINNWNSRKQSEGEWLEQVRVSKEGKPLLRHYKCNLCGVYLATQANYCPNCGARMKGGES